MYWMLDLTRPRERDARAEIPGSGAPAAPLPPPTPHLPPPQSTTSRRTLEAEGGDGGGSKRSTIARWLASVGDALPGC